MALVLNRNMKRKKEKTRAVYSETSAMLTFFNSSRWGFYTLQISAYPTVTKTCSGSWPSENLPWAALSPGYSTW